MAQRDMYPSTSARGISAVACNGWNIDCSLRSMFLRRLVFLCQAYETKDALQVSFRLVYPKDHAEPGC